ncbi:hypothetical protein ColKHC_00792 [Colletotrichum higginsianum]|nr:hypothetical protein ColKHC_00792 [Colletotrichum higginsianum]
MKSFVLYRTWLYTVLHTRDKPPSLDILTWGFSGRHGIQRRGVRGTGHAAFALLCLRRREPPQRLDGDPRRHDVDVGDLDLEAVVDLDFGEPRDGGEARDVDRRREVVESLEAAAQAEGVQPVDNEGEGLGEGRLAEAPGAEEGLRDPLRRPVAVVDLLDLALASLQREEVGGLGAVLAGEGAARLALAGEGGVDLPVDDEVGEAAEGARGLGVGVEADRVEGGRGGGELRAADKGEEAVEDVDGDRITAGGDGVDMGGAVGGERGLVVEGLGLGAVGDGDVAGAAPFRGDLAGGVHEALDEAVGGCGARLVGHVRGAVNDDVVKGDLGRTEAGLKLRELTLLDAAVLESRTEPVQEDEVVPVLLGEVGGPSDALHGLRRRGRDADGEDVGGTVRRLLLGVAGQNGSNLVLGHMEDVLEGARLDLVVQDLAAVVDLGAEGQGRLARIEGELLLEVARQHLVGKPGQVQAGRGPLELAGEVGFGVDARRGVGDVDVDPVLAGTLGRLNREAVVDVGRLLRVDAEDGRLAPVPAVALGEIGPERAVHVDEGHDHPGAPLDLGVGEPVLVAGRDLPGRDPADLLKEGEAGPVGEPVGVVVHVGQPEDCGAEALELRGVGHDAVAGPELHEADVIELLLGPRGVVVGALVAGTDHTVGRPLAPQAVGPDDAAGLEDEGAKAVLPKQRQRGGWVVAQRGALDQFADLILDLAQDAEFGDGPDLVDVIAPVPLHVQRAEAPGVALQRRVHGVEGMREEPTLLPEIVEIQRLVRVGQKAAGGVKRQVGLVEGDGVLVELDELPLQARSRLQSRRVVLVDQDVARFGDGLLGQDVNQRLELGRAGEAGEGEERADVAFGEDLARAHVEILQAVMAS